MASPTLRLVVLTTTDELVCAATFSKAFSRCRARSISLVEDDEVVSFARQSEPEAATMSERPMANHRVVGELLCKCCWCIIVVLFDPAMRGAFKCCVGYAIAAVAGRNIAEVR